MAVENTAIHYFLIFFDRLSTTLFLHSFQEIAIKWKTSDEYHLTFSL